MKELLDENMVFDILEIKDCENELSTIVVSTHCGDCYTTGQL